MQLFIRILIITFLSFTGACQRENMDEKTIDKGTDPVEQSPVDDMQKATKQTPESVQEATEPTASASKVTSRSGDEIYKTFCIACHSIGLANAPKINDTDAWDKVLEIGMDNLVSSAKKGKNAMPPMGTCMDCTDEELIGAIKYMSGTQQQELVMIIN